jgi:hypothetical protein
MKKYIQIIILLLASFVSININAATLNWVSVPAGFSSNGPSANGTIQSSKLFNAAEVFDVTWTFKDIDTPPSPSLFSSLTFNLGTNFTIDLIQLNGATVATGIINSFSGLLLAGNNTLRIKGGVIGQVDNLDVRITPTPIPAAAWLFGSALLGIGGLASRRKSLNTDALAA